MPCLTPLSVYLEYSSQQGFDDEWYSVASVFWCNRIKKFSQPSTACHLCTCTSNSIENIFSYSMSKGLHTSVLFNMTVFYLTNVCKTQGQQRQ